MQPASSAATGARRPTPGSIGSPPMAHRSWPSCASPSSETCSSVSTTSSAARRSSGSSPPASRRARRVVGTVENRPRPEVRGWVLDPGNLARGRMVAIHVNGRLRRVVDADQRRADIARWKGSDGRHGFLWRIPEDPGREERDPHRRPRRRDGAASARVAGAHRGQAGGSQ